MHTEERRPQVDRLWKGFLSAAGQQHRVRDFLEALRQVVVPVAPLVTRVRRPLANAPAAARIVAESSALDGQLRWRFTEEESGALKGVIVSSSVEPLRGASVSLKTDPPRAVVLVESSGELRAEFVIAKDEWRRLARGPVIDKVVFPDGEVVTLPSG
jgi:hypothetical protein